MLGTSLLWRSTVAFTYLKVKSAKCLCLLPVVLVLRIWYCLHHWLNVCQFDVWCSAFVRIVIKETTYLVYISLINSAAFDPPAKLSQTGKYEQTLKSCSLFVNIMQFRVKMFCKRRDCRTRYIVFYINGWAKAAFSVIYNFNFVVFFKIIVLRFL